MSARLPEPLQNLIDTLARLPGIGPKMAARLAFHLLQQTVPEQNRLIRSLESVQTGLQPCTRCGYIATGDLCTVCRDSSRDEGSIAVVATSLDVVALDRSGAYQGVFHVLGGLLSPMDGIGPDQLRIRELEARVHARLESGQATEVILATNPSLEGEATAAEVQSRLQALGAPPTLHVSRIARGLPMGSDIEYADPSTLARALEGRRSL